MKKGLISLLGIIIAAVVVLNFVAPKDFQIEREVIINKPKNEVFSELKYIKNHNKWNPWIKKDPKIVQEYKGTDGTVGFIGSWQGNKEVGVGEQEIKKITEGERIDFELRFKKPFEATNQGYLITEAMGDNQTKVKWGMAGKSEFPINIVCFLMNMKQEMYKEFDAGLASLKVNLESNTNS